MTSIGCQLFLIHLVEGLVELVPRTNEVGALSRVRTGLFSSCFTETMGTFTETMGTFPILSPVRTAQDVFLSVNFTESSGYFSRPTAAQEKFPGHFSRDE